MKFKIYDYKNRVTEVEVPDKPIQFILVNILSGDETGTVYFEDDTSQAFDASSNRSEDAFDGSYVVKGDEVNKWATIHLFTAGHDTKSYKRYRLWQKIKTA